MVTRRQILARVFGAGISHGEATPWAPRDPDAPAPTPIGAVLDQAERDLAELSRPATATAPSAVRLLLRDLEEVLRRAGPHLDEQLDRLAAGFDATGDDSELPESLRAWLREGAPIEAHPNAKRKYMPVSIYVASSWRNPYQPEVVKRLRLDAHDVYDFRHPEGRGSDGFSWAAIDPAWASWSTEQWDRALDHPLAVRAFELDSRALEEADVCVLVLPSGRSAHLEAGFAAGRGVPVVIYAPGKEEPELMARWAVGIATELEELVDLVAGTVAGLDRLAAGGLQATHAFWRIPAAARLDVPLRAAAMGEV